MAVLFDDEISVQYRFAYLEPEDADPIDGFGLEGQLNGLCGAAHPGVLSMTFGLHTGYLPLRIEALADPPPIAGDWEEIVEVSFRVAQRDYQVAAFEDFYPVRLPRSGRYRARFHALGMDAAADADYRDEGEQVIDRYLLQLWPDSAPGPDAILRVTGKWAAYWHRVAQGLEK